MRIHVIGYYYHGSCVSLSNHCYVELGTIFHCNISNEIIIRFRVSYYTLLFHMHLCHVSPNEITLIFVFGLFFCF